jgi:hypothetical protein
MLNSRFLKSQVTHEVTHFWLSTPRRQRLPTVRNFAVPHARVQFKKLPALARAGVLPGIKHPSGVRAFCA